jgi:uncharacterized membrane protein (TIGR02234 family)
VTRGRELGLAVAGLLVGSGLTLLAAARPWARAIVSAAPGLPALEVAPTGRSVAPTVVACALVALAGVLAVIATRGIGRTLIGGAVACMGALIVTVAVLQALDPTGTVADAGAMGGEASSTSSTVWPWVAAVGGLFTTVAGGLAGIRGQGWASLGRRYDAPEADGASGRLAARAGVARTRVRPVPTMTKDPPPATAPERHTTAREQWDALDRGEDPTG